MGGLVPTLNIFYHQVQCFESQQENHNKNVFECFYQVSLSVTEWYLLLPFLKRGKLRVLHFSGRLIGVKTIGKPLSG